MIGLATVVMRQRAVENAKPPARLATLVPLLPPAPWEVGLKYLELARRKKVTTVTVINVMPQPATLLLPNGRSHLSVFAQTDNMHACVDRSSVVFNHIIYQPNSLHY